MAEGSCEVCGKFSDSISVHIIEGTPMRVCTDCGKFGRKEKSSAQVRAIHAKLHSKEYTDRVKEFVREERKLKDKFDLESGERVIDDYIPVFREILRKYDLNPETLAKRINEKESYMSQILSGHFRPSLDVAKKIERSFKVTLIETFDNKSSGASPSAQQFKSSFDKLTFGDLIAQAMNKNKK